MEKWRPGYENKDGIFVEYQRTWFCNTNKVIHGSENEFKNCKGCNPPKKD